MSAEERRNEALGYVMRLKDHERQREYAGRCLLSLIETAEPGVLLKLRHLDPAIDQAIDDYLKADALWRRTLEERA